MFLFACVVVVVVVVCLETIERSSPKIMMIIPFKYLNKAFFFSFVLLLTTIQDA